MDAYMLQRACAATEPIVEQVTPADYANRTPCTEWDVHDLVNHLLATLELGRALFTDTAPETDAGPGEVPSADLAGDDPAKAYRVGMESLLAAATGDAVDRAHATPFGEMPGAMVAGFTAVDVLVHGWDLARATGQTVGFDDALAGEILGFARQTISDDTRAPRIGPEVPAPDGASASAIDRLVAFMGRTP